MERLTRLYREWTGEMPDPPVPLPLSGSARKYFRLAGPGGTAIGCIGTDPAENRAFLALDARFRERGLRAPAVYGVSADGMAYLQEDLGEGQLFELLKPALPDGSFSPRQRDWLHDTVALLPAVQFKVGEGFDWDVCFPDRAFNARMVEFDLNYFKYDFLKLTGLPFDEIRLQDDFDRLRADALDFEGDTFMYRDFQARNVMIRDGEPWFIDFQGGRRGPIYYDVASFIWQARSRYPEELKQELIRTYIRSLRSFREVDEELFNERLRLFVLFRTLQVLGAYGFRGYFEKKPHFLASVPFAMDNLRALLRKPFDSYPYLNGLLSQLSSMPQFYESTSDTRLEVRIYSFAYKKGIPADNTGNGGGYVFDCRSINNPGKYEHYRQFNGNDPEVIKFLEDDGEVTEFLASVYRLAEAHVQRFIERKFTHLQICFGCTGGQHRSVYCAEHLARHLAGKFNVRVRLTHREMNMEKIL